MKIWNYVLLSTFVSSGLFACKKKFEFLDGPITYVPRVQEISSEPSRPETSLIIAYNTSPSAVANQTTLDDGLETLLEQIKGYNVKVTAISLNKSFSVASSGPDFQYTRDPECKTGLLASESSFSSVAGVYYRCGLRPKGVNGSIILASSNPIAIFTEDTSGFDAKRDALKKAIADSIGTHSSTTTVGSTTVGDNFCNLIAAINEPSNDVLGGRPVALALISNQNTLDNITCSNNSVTKVNVSAATLPKLKINYNSVETRQPAFASYVRQVRTISVKWNRFNTAPDGTIQVAEFTNPPFSVTCNYSTTAPYPRSGNPTSTSNDNKFCLSPTADPNTFQNAFASEVSGFANNTTVDVVSNAVPNGRACTPEELAGIAVKYNNPVVTSCTVSARNQVRKQTVPLPVSDTGSRTIDIANNLPLPTGCGAGQSFTRVTDEAPVFYNSPQEYLTSITPAPNADRSFVYTCSSVQITPAGTQIAVADPQQSVPVVSSIPSSSPTGQTAGNRFGYSLQKILKDNNPRFAVSFIYIRSPSECALTNGNVFGSTYKDILARLNEYSPGFGLDSSYCANSYGAGLSALGNFIQALGDYAIDWSSTEELQKVELLRSGVWEEFSLPQVTVTPIDSATARLRLNVEASQQVTVLGAVTNLRITSRYRQVFQ